ncbi:MAG: hypothetical protein DRJ40_03255 [Thermoprotei archaeon]|nr:MAG: hypothetical protein DRJ40_03255 [Thermoprotei archaeon]
MRSVLYFEIMYPIYCELIEKNRGSGICIAFFEDIELYRLYPLVYARPTYEIRIGVFPLWFRAAAKLGAEYVVLFMRDYLAPYFDWFYRIYLNFNFVSVNDVSKLDYPTTLLINGRLVVDNKALEVIRKVIASTGNIVVVSRGYIAVAKLHPSLAITAAEFLKAPISPELLDFLSQTVEVLEEEELTFLNNLWEILLWNERYLAEDIELLKRELEWCRFEGKVKGNREKVLLHPRAQVDEDVVIDVRRGPVLIDEGAEVNAFTYIEGPTYIGRFSKVGANTNLEHGTNIGPYSYVGGELKNVVVQGFTNKKHHGYLGDSYVCEWVNIGAGTVVSNLKNTYGAIKMYVGKVRVDTGVNKIGAFIGDWVKTAVNVTIYCGRKIGPAAHLYGSVYEDVPPFTIYARDYGKPLIELSLDEAIEIQRRMKASRGMLLTDHEVNIMKRIYEETASERISKDVAKTKFTLP